MKEQIVTALQKARGLIEKGWTQGTSARSSDGRSVSPDSSEACCWCPWGALWAVTGGSMLAPAVQVIRGVLGDNPVLWNDRCGRTKEEVLGLFDTAILVAQGQE